MSQGKTTRKLKIAGREKWRLKSGQRNCSEDVTLSGRRERAVHKRSWVKHSGRARAEVGRQAMKGEGVLLNPVS